MCGRSLSKNESQLTSKFRRDSVANCVMVRSLAVDRVVYSNQHRCEQHASDRCARNADAVDLGNSNKRFTNLILKQPCVRVTPPAMWCLRDMSMAQEAFFLSRTGGFLLIITIEAEVHLCAISWKREALQLMA